MLFCTFYNDRCAIAASSKAIARLGLPSIGGGQRIRVAIADLRLGRIDHKIQVQQKAGPINWASVASPEKATRSV